MKDGSTSLKDTINKLNIEKQNLTKKYDESNATDTKNCLKLNKENSDLKLSIENLEKEISKLNDNGIQFKLKVYISYLYIYIYLIGRYI